MIGRARSAYYAFATITFVAVLSLMGSGSRWIGALQAAVAVGILALSSRFTVTAIRARRLNVRRAVVYHAGLLVVAVGGAMRALGAGRRDYSATLAAGTTLLLAIALSNSWQLVITHEADDTM